MSGGWSTAPPQPDEGGARPRVSWWPVPVLVVLVVLVAVLLAVRPWDRGGPPLALPTTPEPTVTTPDVVPTPSPTPTPLMPSPSPTLSSTSNSVTGPTAPGSATVFDAAGAQELFVSTEQIAGVLPADFSPVTPVTGPMSAWGLAATTSITPAQCTVARTVVDIPPVGYVTQSWAGNAVTYRQEVTLLADPDAARHDFATLVGTVDACAQYSEVDTVTGTGSWTTQPAVEGDGLYPSIVQTVTFAGPTATANGYRGHLLVGNAIVTWTAWTPGDAESLGPPDGLAGIVQDRALAAVRAVG